MSDSVRNRKKVNARIGRERVEMKKVNAQGLGEDWTQGERAEQKKVKAKTE